MKAIVLDVRQLSHPEPFEMAMKALEERGEGEYIKMVHRREPFPLYEVVEKKGLHHETLQTGDALYEIYIWEGSNLPPEIAATRNEGENP